MDPIAVDALLLRTQMPELVLREGASVVARVAARAESHGVLVLAGMPLTAQLPEEVAAGDTLRLTVAEVSPERVTLKLDPGVVDVPAPPGAPPQPPRVGVQERPRRTPGGDDAGASVALAFQSEALGRLDLRVEVRAGAVEVTVRAPGGRSYELAAEGADDLRAALREHVAAQAKVTVEPHRDPLDVYA